MWSNSARRQEDIAAHKRSQEALRKSPRLLEALFDNALDAILLTDDQGRYMDANPAACVLTGYSREELLTLAVKDIAPALDREIGSELWRQFLSAGKLDGEYTILCKNGMTRDVQFRAVAHIAPGIHFTANRDITQRKQAEKASGESEERFAKAFYANPVAMAITTVADERFVDVNDSLLRLYGYNRDEVIGYTATELQMAEYSAGHVELRGPLQESGVIPEVEHNFRTKSGELRWGITSLELLELQEVPCVLALTLDVTERKKKEDHVKKAVAELTVTQRLAHLGSWEHDLKTGIVTGTDELYDILGVGPEESPMTFATVLDRVHPADRENVRQIREQACKDHQPFSYKWRVRCADGTDRVVFTRGTVVLDETGKPVYLFGTTQDITEQQQSEDRLASSREQLRALAIRQETVLEAERTHISRELHDQLGQALSALKMDVGWLGDRLTEAHNEESKEKIRHKMADMSQLINTTIRSVREIATKLRPAMLDDLGLEPAIECECQSFEERTGISCAFTAVAGDLDLSREQATAAFRILQEALANVARHAHATHVDVRLHKQNGTMVLEIADNGQGITQSRIADMRSLGLLGMRERTHLLGGDIRFEGHVVDGRGTLITLRIPLQN